MVAKNLAYILIAIITAISIVLISLVVIEKRLHRKATRKKDTKNKYYIEKLSRVNLKDTERTLKQFDKLARNFFREAFKTKAGLEYAELKDYFAKRHNKKAEQFCDIMDNVLYSGSKATKKDNLKLLNILAEIIGSNRIITKKEKKELDKKSVVKEKKLKLLNFLRNIKIPGIIKKKSNNKKNNSKNN